MSVERDRRDSEATSFRDCECWIHLLTLSTIYEALVGWHHTLLVGHSWIASDFQEARDGAYCELGAFYGI